MPKGVRSPRGLPDADRRLLPAQRATIQNTPDSAQAPDGLPSIVQRARTSPGAVSPSEIVTLQRAIGMRAVGSLIAPTLDRERDSVAGTDVARSFGSAPAIADPSVRRDAAPELKAAPSEESDLDPAASSATQDPGALGVDFGGGKGADGFAIRRPGQEDEEQAPSGGKGYAGGLPGYLQLGGRAGDDDERVAYRQEIASFQARNPRERIVSRQRDVLDPGLAADVGPDAHAETLRRKGKGSATTTKTGTTSNGSGNSTPPPAPPVLRKKTVQGPDADDRGGYNWVVQWELDKPSPTGGWIVQGVNVAGNIKDKKDKPLKTGWESYVPYWEAWQVRAGQKVTTYAEGGDVLDDTFANPPYAAGSKGEVSETGTPQFYEGLTLPKSFKANNVTPAGILPATKSDPGLSGGSGLISHKIKATWDSSGGDNKTTLTTS